MAKGFIAGMIVGATVAIIGMLAPTAILSQEFRLKDIDIRDMSAFRGILNKDAIPQEPPPLHVEINKVRFLGGEGRVQPLDGLYCRTCVFENVTFEYSGGNFYLDDVAFINSSQINFKGAAANTLAALALAQWLQSRKPVPEKKPKTFTAKLENPLTVTWKTQE